MRKKAILIGTSKKFIRGILILTTLALCSFFLAQGATDALAVKIFNSKPNSSPYKSTAFSQQSVSKHHKDPTVILKRNIFDSTRGESHTGTGFRFTACIARGVWHCPRSLMDLKEKIPINPLNNAQVH